MIKKKEIDLQSILRKSLGDAFAQHGITEASVPDIPIKTISLGQGKSSGESASKEYEDMQQIMAPLRSKAGISGPVKIENFSNIIETMNKIIGMQEEEFAGAKTGMMDEKASDEMDNAAELLSSVYVYRTLNNILKEQTAHVAGRAAEPFFAALFFGYTPAGDPIQDFYTESDQYISLKIISEDEKIRGSVANLLRGLIEAKDNTVHYLVGMKNRSAGPSRISFFSFKISRNDFLNFATINGVKESFWKDGKISKAGQQFIKAAFDIKPEDEKAFKDKLLDLGIDLDKEEQQQLLAESLVDNIPAADYNDKIAFVALISDPFGLMNAEEKSLFLNNAVNVEAAFSGDKKLERIAISVIKKYRENLKERIRQAVAGIDDNVFSQIINFVTSGIPENKTSRPLLFKKDTKEITKETYENFIENIVFATTNNLKIFNATAFQKNFEDIQDAVDVAFPKKSDLESKNKIIEFFNNSAKTKEADIDFKNKFLTLKKQIKNPNLISYLNSFAFDTSPNLFVDLYKNYDAIDSAAYDQKPPDDLVLTKMVKLLDDEYDDRTIKFYHPEFKEMRKKILIPFGPFLDLRKQVEKRLEDTINSNVSTKEVSDVNQKKFIKDFTTNFFAQQNFAKSFGKIFGDFDLRLVTIPKLHNIVIKEEATLFLNEKFLFQNAKTNADKFEKYMKPIYDNVTNIKEKSDKYFLKNDKSSILYAMQSLKALEEHINTKLMKSASEAKSTEELKEHLNNMTEQAKMVLEHLQSLKMEE